MFDNMTLYFECRIECRINKNALLQTVWWFCPLGRIWFPLIWTLFLNTIEEVQKIKKWDQQPSCKDWINPKIELKLKKNFIILLPWQQVLEGSYRILIFFQNTFQMRYHLKKIKNCIINFGCS